MQDIRSALAGAALMAAGIALGSWLFGSDRAEAQSRPPGEYVLHGESRPWLVNRTTGDTWSVVSSRSGGLQWQYMALPRRSDGCTGEQVFCVDLDGRNPDWRIVLE